jgi:hypothetical protein
MMWRQTIDGVRENLPRTDFGPMVHVSASAITVNVPAEYIMLLVARTVPAQRPAENKECVSA